MRKIQDPGELRGVLDAARRQDLSIGFVPTMGALHEGHLTLCRTSVSQNDISLVSIFVNPLQFGPGEDFERYPRDLEADQKLLGEAGIELVFAPERETIYPPGFRTYVEVEDISLPMEGKHRPGHFRGVATVVLKLFNIVGPCSAYFGEKDFQQLQVIRRMTWDLDVPVEVRSVPTVREPDGLAMSSRNRYLKPEERKAAPAIYRALRAAQEAARAGEKDAGRLVRMVEAALAGEPLLHPEYAALVDPETLQPVEKLLQPAVIAVAVRVGAARLIDNIKLGN